MVRFWGTLFSWLANGHMFGVYSHGLFSGFVHERQRQRERSVSLSPLIKATASLN